jgi:aminoglycoside phosphotransferase family enzyme/predicted kinase
VRCRTDGAFSGVLTLVVLAYLVLVQLVSGSAIAFANDGLTGYSLLHEGIREYLKFHFLLNMPLKLGGPTMEWPKMLDRNPVESPQESLPYQFRPADLLTPAAFAHPVGRFEIRETHISWIILTGLYAYKAKKNVHLEFIDASSLEKRRFLCEEELRLNRRLALDLYIDVVTITREAGGLRIGGHGPVVEYAVRMRQFDPSQELSALLEGDSLDEEEFVDLARRLARFHEGAPKASCGGDYSHTTDLHDTVLGNLATLLSHLGAETPLPEMGLLVDWTHDYLHDSLALLHIRERCGAIRECHGDLHARNIVRWRGQLIPFDGLEFAPMLRWIDVMNDVAFLVMDLMAHKRRDLAFAFLNEYLERTGDYEGVQHLAFYSVYRALVRATVDSLGAEVDLKHREDFQKRLRLRIQSASAFVNRAVPTLFIMHGVSGSGKSWMSKRLVPQLGAIRIRSDVERKRLGGVSSSLSENSGFEQGLYTPALSHRTYARLLECADCCLKGGFDTIVDAAFLHGADRRLFADLAAAGGFHFVILACEADLVVLTERIEQRVQQRVDPSDADLMVLTEQLNTAEPLSASERMRAITSNTSTTPQVCQEAFIAIQDRLASLSLAVPPA